MAKIKLPKQWKHWCKKAKIQPESRRYNSGQSQWIWFSLKGRGRRWRVNCHSQFQSSTKEEYFDRWALSLVASVALPTTEAEFMAAVQDLQTQAQEADFLHQVVVETVDISD